MSIGENIKELRLKRGMEQYKLAELVGVSPPMVSQIERGTKIPSMLLGAEIAKALGCEINDLYAEKGA